MRKLLRRLQYLLRQRRIEAELREEIELHRAMRQRDLEAAGAGEREARAGSHHALGNVTLAKEDARAVWVPPSLESIWQDARYAVRAIHRTPAFTATIVLVTAFGIGATTGIFGLVDGLVLRNLPVQQPHRLVYFTDPSFSYPILREVRNFGAGVFSAVAGWSFEEANVDWAGEIEPSEVLAATGNFFATLGINAANGRLFAADDDRLAGGDQGLVAVISHAAWQRRFAGDPSVVGRTIRIDNRPFTIVGVTPAGFFGVSPGLSPELMVPISTLKNAAWYASHSSSSVHILARLRDGVELDQANAALAAFWPRVLDTTTPATMPAERRAMYLSRETRLASARTGFSRVRNKFAEPLWLLLSLVTLLMLVACASAANLLLARSITRTREVAVRLAIGASRGRLVRQLLTEAAVWFSMAAFVGLGIATWGGHGLVVLMTTRSEPIVLDIAPGWRMAGFSLALALLTAALAALGPAFRATRVELIPSLKAGGTSTAGLLGRWSLGKSLVIAQVALTLVLLFGASLFVGSLRRVLSEDAGIERDGVLVVATDPSARGLEPDQIAAFYDRLLERLRGLPAVQSASLAWKPPISDEDGAWTQSVEVDGVPLTPERTRYVHFNGVGPSYFETLGMRIVAGRDFSAHDTLGATPVVAVNEVFVQRFLAGQNPLGRQITIGRQKSRRNMEIVAVVSNAKYRRLEEPSLAIAYIPAAQLPELAGRGLSVLMRTSGRAAALTEPVRQEVRTIDSAVPLRIESVSDRIRQSVVRERVIAILATVLGAVAILLACAALYGLLSYSVSRQSHEIGVRMALGADRPSVMRLVLRECLLMTVAGMAVGIGASLALGRYATSLLHQISPRDPVALATSTTIMLAVALLAALVPTRRATHVDPVKALRQE